MSYRGRESLLESDYKMKLSKMGYSLDRNEHPDNYYKNMYFEKSNAKNKITRDNTPFYQEQSEQIINKKRQRTSSKKPKQKKYFEFNAFDKEENSEENEDINNKKGIKITRLIESKKKTKPKENIKTNKVNRNYDKENKNIFFHDYNLRSKSKNKNINLITENNDINEINNYPEKNIINFGAQNDDDNNNNKNNNNKDYYLKVKNPKQNNYDFLLKSSGKKEEDIDTNIFPPLPPKKKILSKNVEIPEPPKEELKTEEEKNINNINNNAININNDMQIDENPKEYSETSSYYSTGTSRFSRFSNYTFMSLSRLGSNIVSMKNCIMNKFKRNAYLFPLIILILFGIIFFWNEKYENYDRNNIIIIFSIIMGLIILFNLIMYLKELRKYKKMAKEDKKKLMELFEKLNIKQEDIGNNIILLNQFFDERIQEHGINADVYMNYVFHYLAKYLKRDGYYLEKQKKNENDESNNYWKEL